MYVYVCMYACAAAHPKGGGGLRHGHNPNKGVLGTGTSRKRGVLRTGLVKKDNLSN